MKKMKKRVMAVVLALVFVVTIMIPAGVGGVEAKAAEDKVYVWAVKDDFSSAYTYTSEDVVKYYGTDKYFSLYPKASKTAITTSEKTWEDGFSSDKRLAFGDKTAKIEFTTSAPSELKIWIYDNSTKVTGLYKVNSDDSVELKAQFSRPGSSNAARIITENIADAGKYYLAGVEGTGAYIFKVQVTEKATTPSYSITVNDSKADPDTKTASHEEGAELALSAADTENFLYWKNSSGVIVSRQANTTVTVSKADTYTAFYKSAETTAYNITVEDSKSTPTSVKALYVEGENLTLSAADAEKFLYWKNSNDRIVSRDAVTTFSVYYSDTYTAVYKSAAATVNYMTAFGQKYKSFAATELSVAPEGPMRYGYEFDKWSKTLEEIAAEVAAGTTDIEVTPIYKDITETFDITVDNGTQTKKSYKKNAVVTADASELANFSYWKDENDNILSYNPVYYFFASKVTTVTAVTGVTVEATGIIETLEPVEAGGNKSFTFIFTVPADCEIEFAGIAASNVVTEPDLTSADTLVRGKASANTTVRLTWTKTDATGVTWNVVPILKYKDTKSGVLKTITGTVVSK